MPNSLSVSTTAIAYFGHQRKLICFNHSSGTATVNFHPFHPGALRIHQTCTVFHIRALTASHSSSIDIHTYTTTFATKVVTMLQDLQYHCSTFAGLPIGAMSSSVPSSKPSSKGAAGEAAQGWSRKGGQRIREPRASSKKGSCEIPERNQHAAQGRGDETAKAAAADEWEAPGAAFRLLQPAKAEEKEYGEWGTEHGSRLGPMMWRDLHEEEQDEAMRSPRSTTMKRKRRR